jgi:hypothetical protein
MFRENISPFGGNWDVTRSALVELMYLSHLCYESEEPNEDFGLDVMHYIFNEMHDPTISKRTPPYAPYIMLLINEKVKDMDFSRGNSEHKIKRMNVVKTEDEKEEAKAKGKKPASEVEDVEMDDPSSPVHTRHHAHYSTSARSHGKKKLSWRQCTLLCMNVAIHKENYASYEEIKTIIHNQKSLFREIQLIQDPNSQLSPCADQPTYTPHVNGKMTMTLIGHI